MKFQDVQFNVENLHHSEEKKNFAKAPVAKGSAAKVRW